MSELCYKASNNKHPNCPPRMDDGRHFTDYRPRCQLNNLIQMNNNINNSFQYRMYLTRNAEALMDSNRAYISKKNSCGPCMEPYNQGTMLPESTKVSCNNNSCNAEVVDTKGLGQGRNYEDHKNNQGKCSSWPNNDNLTENNCKQ